MSFLSKLLGGGNVVKSMENIASEWITTDMESAEAKVLMVKTLDPNGMMRRQLSKRVTDLYTLYIIAFLILLILESFGMGDQVGVAAAPQGVTAATQKLTELFGPITTLFGVIVSASFGVNYANTKQGK